MTSVVLLFQLHQPYRLKEYPFFKIGHDHNWEDNAANIAILNRISDNCYLPANRAILNAIRKAEGRFRLAFSISGTLLEQFFRYRPDVLDSFRQLISTGCVEFLAETYYHSPAGLFSAAEFRRQVVKQEKAIQNLLELRPTVLRNTDLLFSDQLIPTIAELGYKTIFAEGSNTRERQNHAGRVLRSAHPEILVLTRNRELSECISSQFDNLRTDPAGPAQAFSEKLKNLELSEICLEIGYETFGEHFSGDSGIISFLEKLPGEILQLPDFQFSLPSDAAIADKNELPYYQAAHWTSKVNTEKDATGWLQNHMQADALQALYACESTLQRSGRPDLLDLWGRLQSSDHFHYMSNRNQKNTLIQVQNPYASPYDAYLNYMNVLSDFRKLLAN